MTQDLSQHPAACSPRIVDNYYNTAKHLTMLAYNSAALFMVQWQSGLLGYATHTSLRRRFVCCYIYELVAKERAKRQLSYQQIDNNGGVLFGNVCRA